MSKIIIHEWNMKKGNDNLPYVYIEKNYEVQSSKFNKNFKEFGFNDIRNVYTMLNEIYDINHLTEEHSYIVAFKGSNLLGTYLLSKGTDTSCDMNPRIIYKFLLLSGASSFIIVHNHPLGDLKMSQEDYDVTKTIIETSELMDIEFIDHIIISDNNWICLMEDIREMDISDCSNIKEYYENIESEV